MDMWVTSQLNSKLRISRKKKRVGIILNCLNNINFLIKFKNFELSRVLVVPNQPKKKREREELLPKQASPKYYWF
jgi:hypothetical protein